MIDKSVLKRLAIQCGAGQYAAYTTSVVMNPEELQAFAATVIEDYKKSLVPVAYEVTANDGKVFLLKNTINLEGHTSTALYALPLGETK